MEKVTNNIKKLVERIDEVMSEIIESIGIIIFAVWVALTAILMILLMPVIVWWIFTGFILKIGIIALRILIGSTIIVLIFVILPAML